jgi:hypothetical protein
MRTIFPNKNNIRPWTRQELILTLELYFRFKGRIPDTNDPDVIGLSAMLADLCIFGSKTTAGTGRSKASIIFKLSNFRSLDPTARAAGKAGFINVANADIEIWKEFACNIDKLNLAAADIKASLLDARTNITPLRANIHILRLLGDELIGSPRLAVFELVKNSYDANASMSIVSIDLDGNDPSIIVQDDGFGMTLGTLRDGWLQIGTPSKRGVNRERTPKPLCRLPLGEKGVGRLAVFRLGSRLELTTRTVGQPEYSLTMDISHIVDDSADNDNSVEDVRVLVTPHPLPQIFIGEGTSGTRIKITKFRDDIEWDKREIRNLQRLITSLSSPFQDKEGEFRPSLEVPGREHYLRGLAEDPVTLVQEKALWVFSFELGLDGIYKWRYNFRPPPILRGLTSASMSWNDSGDPDKSRLEWLGEETDTDIPVRPPRDALFLKAEDLGGIGPIKAKFHVFDRRQDILRLVGESTELRAFLDNQSGIRVYRDGIRVFNYGEPGDDWLELNIKRVNRPGKTLANNAVVGVVELVLDQSSGLHEKTNREGFIYNKEFVKLRSVIDAALEHFNLIRKNDRKALDEILKKDPIKESAPGRFRKASEKIEQIAKSRGFESDIKSELNTIKKEYETLQDLVVSSGAGLNLAIVFHEVEREVDKLVKGFEAGEGTDTLRTRTTHLSTLLNGFGNLLKKATRKSMPVSKLVERAIQLSESRFVAHSIALSCPVLQGEEADFMITGAMNFYLSTLLNLIDNSIYWARKRAELTGQGNAAIQIRMLPNWAAEGPAIAVIDNGDGFKITAEEAMKPFESTKPGGMGLGLYLSRMAMEANTGDLLIPASVDDLEINTKIDGAAVVMRFRRVS